MLRHRYGWSEAEKESVRATARTAAAPFRLIGRGLGEIGRGFRDVARPPPARDLSELTDEEIALENIRFVRPESVRRRMESERRFRDAERSPPARDPSGLTDEEIALERINFARPDWAWRPGADASPAEDPSVTRYGGASAAMLANRYGRE